MLQADAGIPCPLPMKVGPALLYEEGVRTLHGWGQGERGGCPHCWMGLSLGVQSGYPQAAPERPPHVSTMSHCFQITPLTVLIQH